MRLLFIITATLGLILFTDSVLGGFIIYLPIELSFIFSVAVTWILSAFLLAKVKRGLRTYFINLGLSILICGGYYLIAAPLSANPTNWKANLAGIEIMIFALIVWIIWGWILLFYAGIKRFR
ncbi:MAG: hypothetical protein HYZ14_11460 [Bacteroidetes bacterium]|nr:hypothetical protein [Bacteroidota bacterium]